MPGTRLTLADFAARMEVTPTCWLWKGPFTPLRPPIPDGGPGYGRFGTVYAHRFAYEFIHGPVAPELHIDHLCRVTWCVNPDHLEAVPPAVNILRGVGAPAQNATKTHCKNGHPFDETNTVQMKGGWRLCRICRDARRADKEYWRLYRRARRAKGLAS